VTGVPERAVFQPFPWAGALALGLGRLRLTPDIFWSLTPKELILMAGGNVEASGALTAVALSDLMRRFPDEAD
jgi:uncharacterized phage protein (TIGR02216 family)